MSLGCPGPSPEWCSSSPLKGMGRRWTTCAPDNVSTQAGVCLHTGVHTLLAESNHQILSVTHTAAATAAVPVQCFTALRQRRETKAPVYTCRYCNAKLESMYTKGVRDRATAQLAPHLAIGGAVWGNINSCQVVRPVAAGHDAWHVDQLLPYAIAKCIL
jgi:hypothetical protein